MSGSLTWLSDVAEPSDDAFIVPGIVHEGFTLICGKPESGKTFLIESLAHAIWTGRLWLGRDIREKRLPCIWTLEAGGVSELKRRLQEPQRAGFKCLIKSDSPPRADVPTWNGWWRGLAAELLADGVGVLFIDNLSRLLGGGSVNSDADVNPVLDQLIRITELGIAVVLVHHEGKGSLGAPARGPMGHTSIEARARHVVSVSKSGARVTIHAKGNECDDFTFTVKLDPDLHTPTLFYEVVEGNPVKRRQSRMDMGRAVAEHLRSLGPSFPSISKAAEALADTPPVGYELTEKGKPRSVDAWKRVIDREVIGRNGKPGFYRKSGKGNEIVPSASFLSSA